MDFESQLPMLKGWFIPRGGIYKGAEGGIPAYLHYQWYDSAVATTDEQITITIRLNMRLYPESHYPN